MKKINKNQRGAATLIFITIVAIIVTLLITVTQSRVLLSLRRTQSAADTVIAGYDAESEAYDVIARLLNGYLSSANIGTTTKQFGDTTLTITGEDTGTQQTVTVTAQRSFAVSKVQAVREVQSIGSIEDVDIILSLDCTGSMDSDTPTRFESLESAAVNFMNNLESRDDADKFHVGVVVFGVDSDWLKYNGQDVTPDSGFTLAQVRQAIQDGINRTHDESPACIPIMNATSIGTGIIQAHDYFALHKRTSTKQIEIVITDGEPNSRIPDPRCSPDSFCPLNRSMCTSNPYNWSCIDPWSQAACNTLGLDFLRCSIADTSTFVPEINQNGIRDPEVDIYAVTIFAHPPAEVVDAFKAYVTEDGYYNAARAAELTNILDDILKSIVSKRSTVTIKRVIPDIQQ